ncbi:MAG: peroxiredoxin [Flavobacteriales bacterium Tduv]
MTASLLVGKKAPDFKASAVIEGNKIVENFSMEQFKGKYVLLFFYPKDFTFVCPTELHAFQKKLSEFQSRNVQLIAASTDTEQSHWGWLQVPRDKGGIRGITYPIVADTNKTISYNYGVLGGKWHIDEEDKLQVDGELISYRGLFLIDKEGVVRHQLINDLPLGRCVDEALRIIDALQHFEKKGEVCPANWSQDQQAMKPNHQGVADYLSKQ